MISVEEAYKIILAQAIKLDTINSPFVESYGKILDEDLFADRDFPPFDRVMMDGIAFDYLTFQSGQRRFKIEGIVAAGAETQSLKERQNCLEVMTGAVLPGNTDAVVRYEDLEIENGVATIKLDNINQRQNIHAKGSDRKEKDLLVAKGKKISSAEIAIAATVGISNLKVKRNLKVAVIATGDELVEVDVKPKAYQIRKSNVFCIESYLQNLGVETQSFHLLDDKKSMQEKLRKLKNEFDALILSGGVSMGKFDYVPQVLEELGFEKLFHKVKQRPGKPFWFGKSLEGTCVFGLPGNPVSSFACTVRYINPWLTKVQGLPIKPSYAILNEDFKFKPDLSYFIQVKVECTPGGFILASPYNGNGSGDFANLSEVDGFLELERGKNLYVKGEVFRYWGFR